MGQCPQWRVYPHTETVPHWYVIVAGEQPGESIAFPAGWSPFHFGENSN